MSEVIKVEVQIEYEITRNLAHRWTDAEWTEAVEAAIRGDASHEAWDGLPKEWITELEVLHVGTGVRA